MRTRAFALFRMALFPLVAVYAAVVALRNCFFDKKIFKTAGVDAFVLSVGNVSVGGSGKTPFVIYLANLLKERGRKPGVLSRGYGRTSTGYKLVSDGTAMKEEVSSAGDEIYLTARECKVPAAVCEDRVEGARRLIVDTGVDTVLLDDAFQHRWIQRDADIVIVDQSLFTTAAKRERMLLPTGNLREPLKALRRADAVILNRKFSRVSEESTEWARSIAPSAELFTASYTALGLIDIRDERFFLPGEFHGQKSLIVCGVANPDSLLDALGGLGVDTDDRMLFADHKYYTDEEVQRIRKEFYARNSQSVITTQKDAVKLSAFKKELDDIDIYYLKIAMVPDDAELFTRYLAQRIEKFQLNIQIAEGR